MEPKKSGLILGILLTSAFAAITAGCGRAPEKPPAGAGAIKREIVWPKPPLRPRIRFLRTVAQPADLGIHPSFWEQVVEFLAGKEEEWFIRPTGVAVRNRTIYVADPGAQGLWVLDMAAKRFWRVREVSGERLVSPVAVAIGRNGRIYLADSYLAKVFVLLSEGKPGAVIRNPNLKRPAGLAYDGVRDRLYVADSAAHLVWVLDGDGAPVGKVGRRGRANGEFNFPTHAALDREGILYVIDSLGFRVQFFSPEGKFLGQFGRHGDTSGDFAMPKGVAIDSDGHVYVVETLFDTVQIFNRRGRYLLTFGERGLGPGQFWLPGGIFIDPQDRIYVADAYNQRIQIFQYLAEGKR